MYINDYITVFDNQNHTFLLSGKICKITENPKGYSVDGLLFFNPNSDKLLINKTNFSDNFINLDEIKNTKYNVIKNNNLDNTFDYDFFMWDEIEPEVKKICELLNQIDGIETYSSCSGHGIIPPWVDFYIKDVMLFYDLLEFLKDNNQPSKTNKHNEVESKHRFVVGVEGRGTCHLESLEINSKFEELCRVLKKYIQKSV